MKVVYDFMKQYHKSRNKTDFLVNIAVIFNELLDLTIKSMFSDLGKITPNAIKLKFLMVTLEV